jgi:hypothetical protein
LRMEGKRSQQLPTGSQEEESSLTAFRSQLLRADLL